MEPVYTPDTPELLYDDGFDSGSFDKRPWEYRYYFHLIDVHGYSSEIKDELERQIHAFARELGTAGLVLRAYAQDADDVFRREVLSKDWPEEVRSQMIHDIEPFIIVTKRRFSEFDPNYWPWSILWLSGLDDNPQALARIFHKLTLLVWGADDIFTYLDKLGRMQRARNLAKYFSLTDPKFFGVSISVRAILNDLGTA